MNCFRLTAAVAIALSGASCRSWTYGPVPTSEREIRVETSAKPDAVTPRIVAAFLDHELGVTSSQGGIVQAKLPREMGLSGFTYEILAQAVVVPTDSGSRVTLYADETTFGGMYGTGGNTVRVNSGSSGRAGRTWSALVSVAGAIQPDSSRRQIVATP